MTRPPGPTGRVTASSRSFPVLVVVGLGTLLGAMSGSMANIALPDLGRDLGISVETSRWTVQAFHIAVGVPLLLVGRFADLLGPSRLYLTGTSIFGLAALGCGLSGSLSMLVLMRGIQGVGAAMIMACGPALLTTTFPARMRGRALGMLATATYLGLTIGPSVGGILVAEAGWRFAFLAAAPFALLVVLLGMSFLPGSNTAHGTAPGSSTPPGLFSPRNMGEAAALALGLSCLLFFLSQVGSWGVAAPRSILFVSGAVSGLLVFAHLQRRNPTALLDLSLFRSRLFTAAVLSAGANYVALFSVILLMPFYLEEGLHLSTSRAGLLLGVQPLTMAMVASPSGWLSDKLGSRLLATTGMATLALGLWGLGTVGEGTSAGLVAVWLAVIGLGTGIFISPNSAALMGAAPASRQGMAGSVLAQARTLGIFCGVVLASTTFRRAGGTTGQPWTSVDFHAFTASTRSALVLAVIGVLLAGLRGSRSRRGLTS